MSFESVYRSKQGAIEINKITDFLMGLVIKNKYEADAAETSESLSNYYKYYGAYTKTDSFSDYSLDDRRRYQHYALVWLQNLKTTSYSSISIDTMNSLTTSRQHVLESYYKSGNKMYIDYLRALRVVRIALYEEKNTYYRQFLGLPRNTEDTIYLTNFEHSIDGYTEVTDLHELPNPELRYFTKTEEGYYKELGFIKTWYIDSDEGYPLLRAANFYYLNTVAAHLLNPVEYPETYSYYILQENIKYVIEEHPKKTYLRFITDSFTPFYLRNTDNYTVIKYNNGILDPTELDYFFKAYNKARQQVILDYINGFDKKQPMYNLLMLQNLLYYTVINYSNTYIEKYTLGIYTEENLNNILISHGYSKLASIENVELKRRIVKNINDLIANKANNEILEIILDRIIQDTKVELKRYYLEREYNGSEENASIEIDTSKGFEGSVKLTLREIPALSMNELSTSDDIYHDYDTFVANDNIWAGIQSGDTDTTRTQKREIIKREILKLNFNSILTRYITLTRSIDILESQRKLRDSIYLMLNYFDMNSSPEFFENVMLFGDIEVTPAALFGAMCWLQQMKYFTDHETIIKENCVINSSAVFRRLGKLGVDRQSFENKVIVDGKVLTQYDISPEITNWKVIDFIKDHPDLFEDFESQIGVEGERIETIRVKDVLSLGEIDPDGFKHFAPAQETIEDYMMVYRFYFNGQQLGDVTNETTFAELISDYSNQFPNFLKRISMKLKESYDFREYQAWLYLLEQSKTNNSIYFIFKGCNTFPEYLELMNSSNLIYYIYNNINFESENKLSHICTVLNEITESFKNWVNTEFSELIYSDEESSDTSANSSYVQDMILLFNEFLSVYSELYSVDYKYTFGDLEYDGLNLQLFYNPTNMFFKDKYTDLINLTYNRSVKAKDLYEELFKLNYSYTSSEDNSFIDIINNELNIDVNTNEYILDDPYVYESDLKFKDNIKSLIEFTEQLGIKAKSRLTSNLSLTDHLTIIDNYTGDKKIYYA